MHSSAARSLATGLSVLVVLASLVMTVYLNIRTPEALVTMLPLPDMRDLHVDFDTFWHSAVALTQGADIYDTGAKLRNLNPPLLTVLLVPFAGLDVLTAYRIFVVLTLLMVLASVWAVARELRLGAGTTALVLLAVAASSPLHGTLVLGQIYPLLLVGLAVGWIAHRRGHPIAAAVAYGITVSLKPSLAPLLLLPAVLRRWPEFRAGIASAVVSTLAGVLLAGPSSGFRWLQIASAEGVPDVHDNASLPGLSQRFGLTEYPGLLLGLVVLLGTLAWLGRHRDRVDPGGTAPFAVLGASLLLSPISWHNYLMLLVPGVLVLLARGRGRVVWPLLAVALVPVSWNGMWPPDPEGLTAVGVGIGRSFYCGILLAYWVSLLVSSRSERRVSEDQKPVASAGGVGASVPSSSAPDSRSEPVSGSRGDRGAVATGGAGEDATGD